MKTFTTYNGSLRFDLFCGVSCINTVSRRPALHCTDTVCHQTVAAKSLSLWSRDHSGQCWSLLITVDQTMCGQLHAAWLWMCAGARPGSLWAEYDGKWGAALARHRPRTAALAAAERNPVRGFPVKLLLCRLPARARNEPSQGFHNYR